MHGHRCIIIETRKSVNRYYIAGHYSLSTYVIQSIDIRALVQEYANNPDFALMRGIVQRRTTALSSRQ